MTAEPTWEQLRAENAELREIIEHGSRHADWWRDEHNKVADQRDAAIEERRQMHEAIVAWRDEMLLQYDLDWKPLSGDPPSYRRLHELAATPPDGPSALSELARVRVALEKAPCGCDWNTATECPDCGAPLEKVRQREPRMLNPEQFDSIKAGDWYCSGSCTSDRTVSGKKYFWESRLAPVRDGALCYRCAALAAPASGEEKGEKAECTCRSQPQDNGLGHYVDCPLSALSLFGTPPSQDVPS